MTAPNVDPRRLRFPEDRTAFVYTGPNQAILTPPQVGIEIWADAGATTLADITTVDGAPITGSKIFIGTDFLVPEFLGPVEHVTRVWARTVGATGAPYPLDAQYSDQLADLPMLLAAPGPPGPEVGSYGSMYLDNANWVLYGPKTDTWPATGTSMRGPEGPAGGTWEYVQVSPATVWTIAHPLPYRPNVSYVDSAGSVVVGDTAHPSAGVIVATFSAPFAGTALLS